MDVDTGVEQQVSTGTLPSWDEVETLVHRAHEHYRTLTEGTVADYIPVLAAADAKHFGICVAETNGALHTAGDCGPS